MELFVDDQRTEASTAEDANLSVLLEEVKRGTVADNRLIVGISCDGQEVTGDKFAETLATPISEFSRIDMHTAEPARLVGDALNVARGILDASEQAAQQVVDLLAQGKSSTALPQLADCCRAWLQVHEGICNAIAMLNIDPDTLDVAGESMPALMAEPLERLRMLKETIEAGDHVLLGDILTYEFPEALAVWRKMIDAISRTASGECSAGAS